jgi:oryzin
MQLFGHFLLFAAPLLTYAAPFTPPSINGVVPGKWIIQLKPETDPASIAAHHKKVRSIRSRNLLGRDGYGVLGGGMERELQIGGFKAYVGSFDAITIEELKALPEVSKQRKGCAGNQPEADIARRFFWLNRTT